MALLEMASNPKIFCKLQHPGTDLRREMKHFEKVKLFLPVYTDYTHVTHEGDKILMSK